MTRIFVVGCPRSGTTLFQSLLSAQAGIHTFPETHFFTNIVARGRRGSLGLVRKERERALAELAEAGVDFCAPTMLAGAVPDLRLAVWAERFAQVLDEATRVAECDAWLEKTPRHLHHIRDIARLVPGAHFIHVLRDGRGTIASLYRVRTEHREVWGTTELSSNEIIRSSTDRWLLDLEVSHAMIGQENHLFVTYDRMVRDPGGTVVRVFDALSRPIDPEDVAGRISARRADAVALPWETWKSGVAAEIGAKASKVPMPEEWPDIAAPQLAAGDRLLTDFPVL